MLKLGKHLKAKGIKMDTRQLKYIMEIEKAGIIAKAAENLFHWLFEIYGRAKCRVWIQVYL